MKLGITYGIGLLCMVAAMAETPKYASGAPDADRAFTALVNNHALHTGMIRGEPDLADECRIVLDPNFPMKGDADMRRIFREILRSPIRSDIQRFNSQRSAADRTLFLVNDEDCAIREYVGSRRGFRPPMRQNAHGFTLRYSGEGDAGTTYLLVKRGAKTIRLGESRDKWAEIELSDNPLSDCCIAPNGVILKWRGAVIAEWDRRNNWSVLRNVRKGNVLLRYHDASGSGDADRDLPLGAMIVFSPSTVVSIHEKTPRGVRQVATLSLLKSEARPLFQQTERGGSIWRRPPTNFEAQVAQAISSMGAAGKDDIVLSWNPRDSRDLENALQRAGETLEKTLGDNNRNRQVYGSIAMINALNGDVLGIAGYPALSDPTLLKSGQYQFSRAKPEFLSKRVIGSVAKVPVGFSVLMAHPYLRYLRIHSYDGGKFDTILGQQVDSPLSDRGSRQCGTMVDFNCFITHSLNRYAATLLAAAAVNDASSPNSYTGGTKRLGQDVFALRDRNAELAIDRQPPGFLYRSTPSGETLLRLGWGKLAKDMFDVELNQLAWRNASSLSHTYLWRNALRDPGQVDAQTALVDISPEVENFQLNLADNYLSGYLFIILGGGESRWSSIKVAESFARVVTLQKVRASFVRSSKTREEFSPLISTLNDDQINAHRVLLAGLSNVIESESGTGRWLREPVDALRRAAKSKGLELIAYAKTGTPRVDSETEVGTREIIRELVREGRITFRPRVDGNTGHDFYFDGAKARAGAAIGSRDANSSDLRILGTHRWVWNFLSMLNSQTGANQRWYCPISGKDMDCPARRITTKANDDGRNLALVFEVRRGATTCKAIAIAYSNSVKSDGNDTAFRSMVKISLAPQGPVARQLRLAGDDAPCADA